LVAEMVKINIWFLKLGVNLLYVSKGEIYALNLDFLQTPNAGNVTFEV